MTHPLALVDSTELKGLTRAADRLLVGSPLLAPGSRCHRRRAGSGLEFRDFRDFAPGDDPRNIDWRASARSSVAQIRRHYDDRAADWVLCLDRSASMTVGARRKWHLALQLAAAFAYLLLDLDHRVGLVVFSDQVDDMRRPGRGRSAYAQLLRRLYAAEPVHAGGASRLLSCLPHIPPGAQVLVLSDFLAADGMLPDLHQFTQTADRVRALQILDAADAAPPGSGACMLQDIETRATLPALLDPDLSDAARARLDSWRARLAGNCRNRGIAFTSCSAASDWKSALMAHLTGREAALA
ncbi:MAG: DUF58 domain-containing protein [Chromatiaceae bacterium]|nr:DUF58 domain-containing protein [Chromatiaceae bacterium]